MAKAPLTRSFSIPPELAAFLRRLVKSGRYRTTSEAVRDALRLLERQEQERDEAVRRVRAKLRRGAVQVEHGAELVEADAVHAELREMIADRRRKSKALAVR